MLYTLQTGIFIPSFIFIFNFSESCVGPSKPNAEFIFCSKS
jgi:hypothetical protein